MLRNFAAIGLILLSTGQLSAENVPDQNIFTQTSVEQALSQYLNERSKWGAAPSQSRILVTDAHLSLEAYLARRDSWNRPASAIAAASPSEAVALQRYLAKRDTWGTSPASTRSDVTQAQIREALHKLLVTRESWGTKPSTTQTAYAGELKAYLARRDDWNSPTVAAARPSEAVALKRYLAQRESWGTGHASRPDVAQSQIRKALQGLLVTRESWGTAPAIAQPAQARSNPAVAAVPESDIRAAIQALLNERAALGAKPVLSGTREVTDLQQLLARRAAWGEGPNASDWHAQVKNTRVQMPAEALDRRPDTGKANTRVATAILANTRTDAQTCTEAVRQITGSSVIQFAIGSAKLTSQSRRNLKRLGETARGCPDVKIRVEGHTDSVGDAAKNQALSEARAASVANYLASTGINEAAVYAIGFGQSRPLVSNTTSAMRAQNRRIEFTVLTN